MADNNSPKYTMKSLSILEAANRSPITVTKNSSLKEATTIMMFNNFSQLPVSSGTRNLDGYISWETIGVAIQNGVISDKVKDYMREEVKTLSSDTPLLHAIRNVYKNDFVVVLNKDKTIGGLVTTSDISLQFLTTTEPFLLLEQIENHIRQLLDNKFSEEELQEVASYGGKRKVNTIDDLTFGEYISLMENPANWDGLGVSIDRTLFIKWLHETRVIRNGIMHFDPDGITNGQIEMLKNMSKMLYRMSRYKKNE